MHKLNVAIVASLLTIIASGCTYNRYSPQAAMEHTYLGTHKLEDLEPIETVASGTACNQYIPIIFVQTGTATAKDALDLALDGVPEAVALANVTIEERYTEHSFSYVANMYEYCISAFGTPLVPKEQAAAVRERLRKAGALKGQTPAEAK